MADRVDIQSYENMISALTSGAQKIYEGAAQLMGYAQTCQSALGDEDKAIPEIVGRVSTCQAKYAECSGIAMDIAKAMQEELEEMMQEDQVWSGDD